MANYFDNQTSWSWNVTADKAEVITDHGTHTHTLDLTEVSVGDLVDNTGQVMGDAHRAASHDFKEESDLSAEPESAVENTAPAPDPVVDNDGINDGGEDCDDGLDI